MRFYIAAFVGEMDRVRSIQQELRELGHEIAVDWTLYEGVAYKERDRRPEQVREIAVRDMQGVRDSDVFVLLAEPPDGRARYAELGAAIMSAIEKGRPRIYVLGEHTRYSVFFYHPTVKRVGSLSEILADIRE